MLDAIDLETVDMTKRKGWVWPKWIPEGSPSTLYGDGGKGKSLLLLRVFRSVVTGDALPDGSLPGVTGNCLVISGEDSKEEIAARLDALGGRSGKHGKIYTLTDEELDGFSVPKRWDELMHLIDGKEIRYWAIDPVLHFLGPQVRSISDTSVREHVFRPMQRILRETNSTATLLMHMNKDRKGNIVSRASGSGAFVNGVRSTVAVIDNPDGAGFLAGVPKTNRSEKPEPLSYELTSNKKFRVVALLGNLVPRPEYAHLFSANAATTPAGQFRSGSPVAQAAEMFVKMLATGPQRSKPVRESISKATSDDAYKEAKQAKGVMSKKIGPHWWLYFPEQADAIADLVRNHKDGMPTESSPLQKKAESPPANAREKSMTSSSRPAQVKKPGLQKESVTTRIPKRRHADSTDTDIPREEKKRGPKKRASKKATTKDSPSGDWREVIDSYYHLFNKVPPGRMYDKLFKDLGIPEEEYEAAEVYVLEHPKYIRVDDRAQK